MSRTEALSSTKEHIQSILESRKRHRWEPMRFRRLKRKIREQFKEDINESEFIGFFKDLETAGYGSILWSKHKNPIAFKWSEPITRLSKFIATRKAHIETSPSPEAKTHLIVMDGDNKIKVELTGDLDAETKRKLAKLILSI